MHKQHHGGIEVNWTDGEWERLQAIKGKRWESARPDRSKRAKAPAAGKENCAMCISIRKDLSTKARQYARDNKVSLSHLISLVMEVITDDNT